MQRAAVLILSLIGLLAFAVEAEAQVLSPGTYVQWGLTGTSATNGYLNATSIPPSTGNTGVRYSNVNGMGYDLVVVTDGLVYSGGTEMPWNDVPAWWYEAATASKLGDSIPYSTISFHFYLPGSMIPFGVTGVNFTFQNAKVGERYRYFNYWDTVGTEVALSFTNYNIFSYANGPPRIHLSDSSIDTGIPYTPGNYEGDWIGVNMAPMAISGFTFQTGRIASSYGSNYLTALGYLVPTGQLLIESGNNVNISDGPNFVSTGSNAVLTPMTLTIALAGSDVSVASGDFISQNIVINEDILSGFGNSLSMCASQNILSATSEVSLSTTSGDAGSLSLTAVTQSVITQELDATAESGAGGAISINAGNYIKVTGGIDTSASTILDQGGDITLNAGNSITVDTITSGGDGPASLGEPGSIALSATNAITVGAIYDNAGPGSEALATLAAPSITLGPVGNIAADISGTLELEKPISGPGASIAVSGSMIGTGGVLIDAGTGAAMFYNSSSYTGETEVVSGVLDLVGNSLPESDMVLEGTGALSPGVMTSGSYVSVNALTVGTDAALDITLTNGSTYDQVTSAGPANLDGIFNLTVAPGFNPTIGELFQVVTSSSLSGEFATYTGVRLPNCVLEPEYTATGMVLVTSTIPTGASLPLDTVPASGESVPAGGSYDGLTASLQAADPYTVAATLIDGTASQATTVTMSLAASGTNQYQIQGSIGESLLNLLGTGTDKVVVQLDYNEASALAAAGDERQLFLATGTDGSVPFSNAVLSNTDLPGEANNPTEFLRAYNPATDFHLGYYGVDTINNRVWAVVDYDGWFGLGAQDVSSSPAGPSAATEPATGVASVSATLNGLVNCEGYPTQVMFEICPFPDMAGSTISPVVAAGLEPGFIQASYQATGLTEGVTYYYRVDATTFAGTEYGGILSFTTPESGMGNWRYANFGTYSNTGNAADTADPMGDGVMNLLKYATGESAMAPGSGNPAVIGETGTGSGAYLTLTFNEIADPTLTYSVQAANSLAGTWTTIWTSTGASNTAGSVTVRDVVTMGQQPGRFLRLQVSH